MNSNSGETNQITVNHGRFLARSRCVFRRKKEHQTDVHPVDLLLVNPFQSVSLQVINSHTCTLRRLSSDGPLHANTRITARDQLTFVSVVRVCRLAMPV